MFFAPHTNEGFSLLEMLVAIAILSIAVIPMLATQSTAMRSTTELNEKLLARMVAENAMTELRLSEIPPAPGILYGDETQAGLDFTWQADVRNIPQQPLTTILLSVSMRGETMPKFQITGFRKKL